jgi:hypothetical protein
LVQWAGTRRFPPRAGGGTVQRDGGCGSPNGERSTGDRTGVPFSPRREGLTSRCCLTYSATIVSRNTDSRVEFLAAVVVALVAVLIITQVIPRGFAP